MTLPTIVTVKATITDSSGPVAGRISWHRNVSVLPASPTDEVYLIPEVVETTVGADGVVEQPLYSCNDPAASPTGWTWTVYPHFPHWRGSFDIVVPYDAVDAEVNLSQLAPVPQADGDLYALVSHTHSGGGGGGSVDSVFGRTGAVTAQSGDYTATQITSGTFAIGRIPTGTSGTTAALGNHAHTGVYDPAGTATSAVTTHTGASNPHPEYLTSTEGDAAYAAVGHTHGGGGGATLRVDHQVVSAGSFTPQASVGWSALTGGPVLSVAASVGDYVEMQLLNLLHVPQSGTFIDFAVQVGGSLVRFASNNTATPAIEGVSGLYRELTGFIRAGVGFGFVVESGDLSAGEVNIVWAVKGDGGGTIYASTAYPLVWRLINHGAPA